MPIELLRQPSLPEVLGVAAFAAFAALSAIGVFRLGLRRYQSGNLVDLRG